MKIQKLLPDSTTLIEYVIGEETSHVFWLNKSGLEGAQLTIGSSLLDELEQFRAMMYRKSIRVNTAESYESMAVKLYKKLVYPVEKRISAAFPKWIVVPDGPLGYINFVALLSATPEKKGAYQDYPFLIKTHQLSYQYSASLMQYLTEAPANVDSDQKDRLLAFVPSFSASRSQSIASSETPV